MNLKVAYIQEAERAKFFDTQRDRLYWKRKEELSRALSQKSRATKSQQAVAKVSEVSSRLGSASTAGLGKAVEVLDTLGSSMTN
ncbi:hypothetical protein RchiOBHm_Chr5g0037881 [Rosa chinensis]|uniref:Uncharacterized protein n=1 Tax=Rosa chinensis TaxID=74649 RepID=A0A2P6QBV1_ROSCH|nr:hypothetical protein RchiOBHm_Chr5g0037881 [Rosa chinensis]